LVLTIDDDRGTADVLMNNKAQTETTVDLSEIQRLFPFETHPEDGDAKENVVETVERLKTEARDLFAAKDYDAATEWYTRALGLIEREHSWRQSRQAEPIVLVTVTNQLRTATVLAVRSTNGGASGGGDDRVVVAIVDHVGGAPVDSGDAEGESDEVHTVHSSAVAATVSPQAHRQLQSSLYLNLARCALGLDKPARALWWSTMALRVAGLSADRGGGDGDGGSSASCGGGGASGSGGGAVGSGVVGIGGGDWAAAAVSTGYFLRAKAHLLATPSSARSIGKARRDAARADAARPGQREITALLKDVAKREGGLRKIDRELAREIGKWTELAMKGLTENEESVGGLGAEEPSRRLLVTREGGGVGVTERESSGATRLCNATKIGNITTKGVVGTATHLCRP
jgi:catechol 2,3-dioxygenase-like lactoylglutathione lyase family enzyme